MNLEKFLILEPVTEDATQVVFNGWPLKIDGPSRIDGPIFSQTDERTQNEVLKCLSKNKSKISSTVKSLFDRLLKSSYTSDKDWFDDSTVEEIKSIVKKAISHPQCYVRYRPKNEKHDAYIRLYVTINDNPYFDPDFYGGHAYVISFNIDMKSAKITYVHDGLEG